MRGRRTDWGRSRHPSLRLFVEVTHPRVPDEMYEHLLLAKLRAQGDAVRTLAPNRLMQAHAMSSFVHLGQ
jgi:hypothetical protein